MSEPQVLPISTAVKDPAPLGPIIRRTPLDWAILATQEPPPREWFCRDWLGYDTALLVGRPGIGKTTLAMQLMSSGVLGRNFISDIPEKFRCGAWLCEDTAPEIWLKQVDIARWLGVPISTFAGMLNIVPRHGLDNTLVVQDRGQLAFTPTFEELREQVNDLSLELMVLDNVGTLYGADENSRHQVTTFISALSGALPQVCTLLLAHPARAAGSEFAGSAAWEAAVRTRLFLDDKLPDEKGDDDAPADAVRYLSKRKSNYSAKDFRRFTYSHGVFVPEEVEAGQGTMNALRAQRAHSVVIEAARKLLGMGLRITDASNSPEFLPRRIVEYKLGEGLTKKELADAMRDAMLDKKLARVEVGKYANRSPMFGLQVQP